MVTIISKPSNGGGGSGSSTSKVKVSAVDTTEGFLAAKLVAGANVTLTASGAGNETLTIAASGGVLSDEKVKYDANDTAAGYLGAKTVAGTGISLAEGTGGDADKLVITNSAPDQTVAISAGTNITSVTGTYPNFTVNAATQTTDISGKVDKNAAITGATKTKITYDAKGLVTAGADATTADIAASTNKNYVTDAQATVIANTSGSNSGDNATNSQYSGLATLINGKKYFHGVVQTGVVSPLPTNLTTTTFTLAANTTPITYRYLGASITVNTAKTATLAEGAGLYFVYFNGNTGNILATKAFPGITNTSNVIIASVYWNGTNYGLVYDERHSYDRDHAWHIRAHDTIGCRYQSGLNFSFAGNVIVNTTFALSTGTLHDEDIDFSVAGTTARIWYQTGASAYNYDATASTTPYKQNGTGIQAVNSTGYGLVTITASNRYFNYWVYGTNDVLTPIHIFCETTATIGGYTSVGNARAVAAPSLAGFGLAPEYKLLYRVVVNGAGLVQTPVAGDDYRTTSTVSGGALTTVSASGVTENNYGNVQSAIDTLITMTGGSSDQSLAMIAM